MGTQHQNQLPGVPKPALYRVVQYLLDQAPANPDLTITASSVAQYHKNFQLLNRLRGAALCLLKTNFTKKPVDHG